MRNIVTMCNQIKNYTWGDPCLLHDLFGVPNPNNEPQAEMWMGAHPAGSSFVTKGSKTLQLHDIIAKNPMVILGESNTVKFNDCLPYLFKILAVKKPLSIQVHPNKEQGFVGYARENLLEIPLDAPERNYRDPNGKPELLYALSSFSLLCGFRPLDEIKRLLCILTPRIFAELELAELTLKSLFAKIISMTDTQTATALAETLQNADQLGDRLVIDWIRRLAVEFSGDIGVIMPAMLNPVILKEGQAIAVPPRMPHAYLHGLGLELVGNSDNVLRCALTPKHKDLQELLNVTEFVPRSQPLVEPKALNPQEMEYYVDQGSFVLNKIFMPVQGQVYHHKLHGPEILLCTQGKFQITRQGRKTPMDIRQGQSVFVSYGVGGYNLKGQGAIFKVMVI